MKCLDEKFWYSVCNGWKAPVVTIDGVDKPKPIKKWTSDELAASGWNSQGLNVIFNALTADEFKRVQNCELAKEAWNILELAHEGNAAVKRSKLQTLTKKFENIRMEENETFYDFYARFNEIVNSCHSLGKKIYEYKFVSKILRPLPERFQAKVTAIE